MALVPKTAVLQIRLDPDLLADFRTACEARNRTASDALRLYIREEVVAYGRYLAKTGADGVSGAVSVRGQGSAVKTAPRPVKSVVGGMNRAQRRAEKGAR